MIASTRPLRLSPSGVVLAPLIVLSIVYALVAIVVSLGDRFSIASPSALLISGALLYAAAVVTLGRSGFASVRDLELGFSNDPLTALPNRRALHADLKRYARRSDEIALAIVSFDDFKEINDRYGHETGDDLIRMCAELLTLACDGEARCYRLTGNEFAAATHGKVAGTILEGLCRTVLQRLDRPLETATHLVPVGASVGLARTTASEQVSSSELLRRADVAQCMSKRAGKMRCTWFSESFDQQREIVREIEDELRASLMAGDFELHYQPLVDTSEGRIVAVEALIRWTRPDGRNMPPDVFVPIAEQSGIIHAMGLWVLRTALFEAARWGEITISVNLSAAQLRNPEFPIKLGEILEETGFDPARLELEVTETCLVLDPIVAERALNVIRQFGVRIALDDFGTGYASIGFLRRFRFEKLKLDRSLVIDAGQDDGSRAMMASSITLARALDMGVTAEGVETVEQAEMVRLAGCDRIQGWLYYRAVPAEEIDRLMAIQNEADNDDNPLETRSILTNGNTI
ncbi:MAG: bifunctional diguanylate cyclase/phosphodiesterase [Erythrobacter sp.]